MEGIKLESIAERRVEWIPNGWDWSSNKTAIIRDGKLEIMPLLDHYFVEKDPDGAIEFLQAIKRAMAETRK